MDLFGHLASSSAHALLQGLDNAPTSQAAGQEAIAWHWWSHHVTSEVSLAGAVHVLDLPVAGSETMVRAQREWAGRECLHESICYGEGGTS